MPAPDNSGNAKISAAKAEADIRTARYAMAAKPNEEAPVRALIDALVRVGRYREALIEADRFIARGTATAALRGQRGYLRRELGDVAGAAEDFAEALKGRELSTDQRRNVEAALAEAQAALAQGKLDHAQGALARGDFAQAADEVRLILESDPNSGPAMRIRVEALTGGGRKREALAEADQFVQRAPSNALLRAQRGFLRREFNDPHGAAEDFVAALADGDLTAEQRRNLEAGLAEARAAEAQAELDRAEAALKRRDYNAALEASRAVLQRNPSSEAAIRIRIEALSGLRRKRDALAAADGFIARHAASAALRAQRGYLRRELRDIAGAIVDFTSALAGDGLSVEQKRNVQAALAEARTAQRQAERGAKSGAAARVRIDALLRAGRKRETQVETDRLISGGHAQGWVYAQRGFTRFAANDFQGATQDFDAALARGDLDSKAVPNIRYARAQSTAMQAEHEGKPQEAEAAYREFLQTEPNHADAWYKLGYLLLKQGSLPQGAQALNKAIEIRPVATAYPDAAGAYLFTSAPLASKLYRQGLDRWYAGDPSLAGKSETDFERVKNAVVEADASIRTTLGVGTIQGRPESAGGTNNILGEETRGRFDGRYLPAVPGLEAFARGLSGKDSNGERETDAGVGLRFRPIRDLNLFIGGAVDHFFEPKRETEFVLNWGLGLGADAYPYAMGWQPYWDFGTIGVWRTADARVLEDVRGNLGVMYDFRFPIRGAVGPTVLAVAGYDSKATIPWATGIGPSVLSYFWLGGDKYRSYDAILSLQLGYIFNVGIDERQRGWRGRVSLTF